MKVPNIENVRTLAAVLGIKSSEASSLLETSILITQETNNPASRKLNYYLKRLLSHTVTQVLDSSAMNDPTVEIIVGDCLPVTNSTHVWVSVTFGEIIISSRRASMMTVQLSLHDVVLLLAACYAAGAALREVAGGSLPFPNADPLVVPVKDLVAEFTGSSVSLEETYMAGAGAVANGFLWALSTFQVTGILHIADPDSVDNGNLNRCVWFNAEHLGSNKAECLAETAQPSFSNLRLLAYPTRLQELPRAKEGGAWLERLVVTVDSRRARRRLQTEIPREIYDGSTTGIEEIVLHFNRQPTELACLSCVYDEVPNELAHETHVGQLLGVTVEQVREHYISRAAAELIHTKYSLIPVKDLLGLAYDSLFKTLCGEGHLQTPEDRQVLAPFAFVSVLAGTYLAIEFVRRLRSRRPAEPFNYWRLSPWSAPQLRLRQIRPRNPVCEFCSQDILRKTAAVLWANSDDQGCLDY